MKVHLGGGKIELTDQDIIGIGGEATVYRKGDRAIKIYHPISRDLAGPERELAERVRRLSLAKLREFPANLPAPVVVPEELVTDRDNRVIGYSMALVPAATTAHVLSQRRWREGVLSSAALLEIFSGLHRTLRALHSRGVIVGDLNDSNILFADTRTWLIDADSMQFGSFPCPVAHERFLDPRLYGIDLLQAPRFDPDTDWYCFAVLLFQSLLYVHPYGGVHPAMTHLLRRAQARHSVMRPDVAYPKSGRSLAVLPDDLLHWFEGVFDHGRRGTCPEALLAIRWTLCPCGEEHAKAACPACQRADPRRVAATRVRGGCRAVTIHRTPGRILAAAVQGSLRYAYQEDGMIYREGAIPVAPGDPGPLARVALQGDATWIGEGTRLVKFLRGEPRETVGTGTSESLPVFDANQHRLFTVDDCWLMEQPTGLRLGKVLPGLTWIRTGERLGVGFYRAGRLTFYFLFRPGGGGIRDITLPSVSGRLLDAQACFDEEHALLLLAFEECGRICHAMYLIAADGSVVGSLAGSPDEVRSLFSLAGKAISGGRVLTTTDEGLLSLKVDPPTKSLVEGRLFTDTEPFVAAGDTVLPGPGGSVYVVKPREILQLTLV